MKVTLAETVKIILDFIEKLYNSIRYNGLYLLLSLLFPYIIYKLDAGHEIIENILEDQAVGLNISAIMLSFLLLSFSVWCVPTFAITLWKWATGNTTQSHVLYKYLSVIYSGAGLAEDDCHSDKITPHLQIPIKYFAVFPWLMFIFTCVYVFFKDICITALAVALLIGMLALTDAYGQRIKGFYGRTIFTNAKNRVSKRSLFKYSVFLVIFTALTGVPWLIDLVSPGFFKAVQTGKWVLIWGNFAQVTAFYIFINYLENLPKEKIDAAERFIISRFNYVFVLLIILSMVGILFVANRSAVISVINPIFVVVTVLAAFIMFFDVFFTAQLLLTRIATEIRPVCGKKPCAIQESNEVRLQFYRVGVSIVGVVLVVLMFFKSANGQRIREVATGPAGGITDTRSSLDAYFMNWLATNHGVTKNSDKNITIYLISGPGGGSRAATWFYLTMKELDQVYGDKFYKSVFSISTVSGSTSGANMYLAEKHLGIKPTASPLALATSIYSENYFSGTFFGLLLGDGIESVAANFSTQPTKGRNHYFQKEEMNGFTNAYQLQGNDLNRARAYFENDLMYAYGQRVFPLFFINTTLIDCGKRGIFSPVKLAAGKDTVSIGVDLYDRYVNFKSYIKDKEELQKVQNKVHYGLPMITCVNQSQAFPLINSYDYLEGAGRLCDGGLYDNSGCSTTLEIYQALRKYIKRNNLKNIKIVCLNIINGDITNDFKVEYKSPSILNTLQGVASLPFSGNETYAFFNLQRQIKNHIDISTTDGVTINDAVITLKPERKYNLTRMLSKKAIDSIHTEVKRAVARKNKSFDMVTEDAANIGVNAKVKREIIKDSMSARKVSLHAAMK